MQSNFVVTIKKQRDQGINNICTTKGASSPKKRKIQDVKWHTIQYNTQFSVPLVLEDEQKAYKTCKLCSLKSHQLQFLQKEISYLQQKNSQFKEEIQLLFYNFSYIIELVAENITKGVKSRVGLIFKQKQSTIEKLQKTIKNLQSQSEILVQKIDSNMEIEAKVQKMQEKIKDLEQENKTLKEMKKKQLSQCSQCPCQSFIQKKEKKTIESESSNQVLQCFGFSKKDLDERHELFISRPTQRIEKRKTLQMSLQKLDEQQSSKIKSLSKLKTKIGLIREKLTYEALK